MDTKYEDTMVRQIEKNLSNNINENLFLSGRVYDSRKLLMKKNSPSNSAEGTVIQNESNQELPLVSNEYITNLPANLSRAEYIRQAREACLRQLSNSQIYSRPYDVNYSDTEHGGTEQTDSKKTNALDFYKGADQSKTDEEENSPQEIAAFRALIIRTVCAILLFISIFVIDKFELKIGNLTNNMIQEYITGNDTLNNLEDVIVTWLK